MLIQDFYKYLLKPENLYAREPLDGLPGLVSHVCNQPAETSHQFSDFKRLWDNVP